MSKNSVFVIHDWEDETFEPGFERALDDMVRRVFLCVVSVGLLPSFES